MLKDKKNIIIGILIVCVVILAIALGFQSNEKNVIINQYENLTKQYIELEENNKEINKKFQEQQQSLIILNSWFTQDGTESAEEGGDKINSYKEIYSNYIELNENLEYATEEQKIQLEELIQKIKDSRNIKELEELIQQVEEIDNAITQQKDAILYFQQTDFNYNNNNGSYYYNRTSYSFDEGSGLTPTSGVNYYDGRTETYYSSNILYHYNTSAGTLDDEGFYKDDNGNYVVAASDMAQGTTFEGSKGTCIVLDTGCAPGVTDYYVAG